MMEISSPPCPHRASTPTVPARLLLAALWLCAGPALAAKAKGKKAPTAAPATTSELKKAQPEAVPAPAVKTPAPTATTATEDPDLAPLPKTRVIEAYGDAAPVPAPAAAAVTKTSSGASAPGGLGLLLAAQGGVSAPLSVLGAGVRAGALLEYRLWREGPLKAQFSIGYERHVGAAPRQFAPPAGGFDPAAIENQSVMPVELGLTGEAWHDDANAITLGGTFGLVGVWTQTNALGSVAAEAGLGEQLALEAGYSRRMGSLELFARGRWALRHTGVGFRTNATELPWYQTAGLVLGIGYSL